MWDTTADLGIRIGSLGCRVQGVEVYMSVEKASWKMENLNFSFLCVEGFKTDSRTSTGDAGIRQLMLL